MTTDFIAILWDRFWHATGTTIFLGTAWAFSPVIAEEVLKCLAIGSFAAQLGLLSTVIFLELKEGQE